MNKGPVGVRERLSMAGAIGAHAVRKAVETAAWRHRTIRDRLRE